MLDSIYLVNKCFLLNPLSISQNNDDLFPFFLFTFWFTPDAARIRPAAVLLQLHSMFERFGWCDGVLKRFPRHYSDMSDGEKCSEKPEEGIDPIDHKGI